MEQRIDSDNIKEKTMKFTKTIFTKYLKPLSE